MTTRPPSPALGLAAAAAMILAAGAALAQPFWHHYANARFGTAADVPADFLADESPANGDGQRFVSPDGTAEIRIYGAFNVVGSSLEDYRRFLIDSYAENGWVLTYTPAGADWLVISGVRGEEIVYLRAELGRGCPASLFHHVEMVYPVADAARWDGIVGHVAKSLAGPCG